MEIAYSTRKKGKFRSSEAPETTILGQSRTYGHLPRAVARVSACQGGNLRKEFWTLGEWSCLLCRFETKALHGEGGAWKDKEKWLPSAGRGKNSGNLSTIEGGEGGTITRFNLSQDWEKCLHELEGYFQKMKEDFGGTAKLHENALWARGRHVFGEIRHPSRSTQCGTHARIHLMFFFLHLQRPHYEVP